MWVWTVVTINDTSLLPTSRNQPREQAQYLDCVIINTVVNKQSFPTISLSYSFVID